MKTRILRNWRSSLLGLTLLITIIALLILKILTGGEFIALLPTILGLIYVRDSIFRLNPPPYSHGSSRYKKPMKNRDIATNPALRDEEANHK